MGMFDTFEGKVKCPYCKEEHLFFAQTKSYDCLFNTYGLGSYIDKANQNYIYETGEECFCSKTKKSFYVDLVIYKGQLVKMLSEDESESVDWSTLENIEEDYWFNLLYKEQCEKKEGIARETMVFPSQSFKINDVITALSIQWTISACYKKELNHDYLATLKSKEFLESLFLPGYIYKVRNNDTERFLIIEKHGFFNKAKITIIKDLSKYLHKEDKLVFIK